MSKTKKVISKETQEKITNSIIQLLAEEKCTLANYEEIHELVINYYKSNATLPIFLTTNRCHRLRTLLEDCMSKFQHSSEK